MYYPIFSKYLQILPIFASSLAVNSQISNIYQEEIIIKGIREGNQAALRLLFQKYGKALKGVIFRIINDVETSEDLLQETFVKIWQNFDLFDENKGKLFTWMLNIARNTAIDKLRSTKFIQGKKIQELNEAVPKIDAANNFEIQLDHIGIQSLTKILKPELKEVVDLVYFLGYSHSEAAENLNIPLGTVKTRIRSAINELRKVFV